MILCKECFHDFDVQDGYSSFETILSFETNRCSSCANVIKGEVIYRLDGVVDPNKIEDILALLRRNKRINVIIK